MREITYSVVLAATYAATAGGYIIASTQLSASSAASVDDLASRELLKGLVFVLTTAALLWIGSYTLFRRLRAADDTALTQREALLGAERAALTAHMASTIAHDFKNELTVAHSAAEFIRGHLDANTDAAEALADLQASLRGATALATNLSKLGRGSLAPAIESVDLAEIARESLRVVRHHPHLARCRLEQEIEAVEVAKAQPTFLVQALINLLLNAGEATGGRGTVRLRVERADDRAVIEVDDDGPGVPDELLERIFEPFFTTKENGTGLGLLSVRMCVERNGGTVQVEESSLGGACFQLRFPAKQ